MLFLTYSQVSSLLILTCINLQKNKNLPNPARGVRVQFSLQCHDITAKSGNSHPKTFLYISFHEKLRPQCRPRPLKPKTPSPSSLPPQTARPSKSESGQPCARFPLEALPPTASWRPTSTPRPGLWATPCAATLLLRRCRATGWSPLGGNLAASRAR